MPYRVFPGGKAGIDYNYFISTHFQQAGVLWGKWLDTALHCKGNVVNLGGPPANSQSLAEYQGHEVGDRVRARGSTSSVRRRTT